MFVVSSLQAVEGVVLLPEQTDLSQIGVKNTNLHFVTAGSKGLIHSHLNVLFPTSPSLTCAPLFPCRHTESVGGKHCSLRLYPEPSVDAHCFL